ncbi:MAG: PKD domain-containing protein [Opitutae bacterium]|nr:PKD domain-containing protein [Opitutae bacterium]
MKELIALDPRAALAHAVPRSLRSELPKEIVAQLEIPIDAFGEYQVIAIDGDGVAALERAAIIGNQRYQSFTYGRRLEISSKSRLPIHGIAIDDRLAIAEEPYRRLEPAEQSNRNEQPDGISLAVGDEVHSFASSSDFTKWKSAVIIAEATLGPDMPSTKQPTAAFPAGWTTGEKTVLWIRAEFSDNPGLPATDAQIDATMATVNQFYLDVSGNRSSFKTTIMPVGFRLAQTQSYYNANPNLYQDISTDALQQARSYDAAQGGTGKYNPDRYDRWIVIFKKCNGFAFLVDGKTSLWAGRGAVGSKGLWLNGYYDTITVGHELGHNHGLRHSHAWKPTGASTISPGTHVEYGDTFDVMGACYSMPAGHFNTKQKENLLYLDSAKFTTVTTSGTYRINRHDHRDAGGVQALKIAAGSAYEYLLEHRQQTPRTPFSYTSRVQSGVQLRWSKRPSFTSGTGTYLLDLTPTSTGGMEDGSLPIGETFTDPDYGITIAPVANGGTAPSEWIDIQVTFGASGTNRNPSISADAPTGPLRVRTDITFTASGTDPDGDKVYFRWNFGDGQINPNTATVSHRWLQGGKYTVQCTALDGKGGFANKSFDVVIEDPLQTWTRRAEGLSTSNLYSIVYADGQFVAAGSSGTLMTSSDGISWTRNQPFNSHTYLAISHGNSAYVAVGYSLDLTTGNYLSAIVRSLDGVTWTNQSPTGVNSQLRGVTYGGGKFVAVGRGGVIYKSNDGIEWSSVTSGTTKDLMVVNYSNGRFVAAGSLGTILTSTDGLSWTNQSVVSSYTFYGVAHRNGRWLVSMGYEAWASTDTLTWSASDIQIANGDDAYYYSLATAPQTAVLIAPAAEDRVLFSENGIYWADAAIVSTPTTTGAFLAAVEGNGTIVVVGSGGRIYQAGTPRLTAPTFASAETLTRGLSVGQPLALPTLSAGYSRVQMFIDGNAVAEKSTANATFSWIPSKFGSYRLSLVGTTATGETLTTHQRVTVGLFDWRWQSPSLSGNTLRAVTRALNRWWAVGEFGTVLSSVDGASWTIPTLPLTSRIEHRGLASDGKRLVLATYAYESSSSSYKMPLWTTTDGERWQGIAAPNGVSGLNAITYNGNLWLAVGNFGAICTSTDGVIWTGRITEFSSSLYALAYGNGLWVATGSSGTIITSSDGTTWTAATVTGASTSTSFNGVAFLNGRWVATGLSGIIYTSTDGKTWTSTSSGVTNALYSVSVISGQYVVTGSAGTILTSTDGQTWKPVANARKASLYAVAQSGTQYIAVGQAGEIQTGDSLATLTARDTSVRTNTNVLLADDSQVLSAHYVTDPMSGGTIAPIATRKIGEAWLPGKFDVGNALSAYGLTRGQSLYVAVGNNGVAYTSTDARTWITRSTGSTVALYSVAASNTQFAAVGVSGRIATSSDGATWTARTSGITTNLNTISYGNQRFVAAGDGGIILSSDNGTDWTKRASGVTTKLRSSTWYEGPGFVIVGDSGAVLTSIDGVTWTKQSTGGTDTLIAVTATQLGLVVTQGVTTYDRAFLSNDGKNWILTSFPTGNLYALSSNSTTIWAASSDGRLLTHSIAVASSPISIATQPTANSIREGEGINLSVQATGISSLTYQWYRDGQPLPGATNSNFSLDACKAADAGTYSVLISDIAGNQKRSAETVLNVITLNTAGRLTNLSIRTGSGTGDQMLIVGVSIGGANTAGNKALLIRGIGPTLGLFGVRGALSDPQLKLLQDGREIDSNNDWGGATTLRAAFGSTGAFDIDGVSKDAALLADLSTASYTVQLSGNGGTTGITLAEIYDATPSANFLWTTPRLINASARTLVGAGDDILIAGFVVGGSTSKKILVRAIGPTLGGFGVSGALSDPKLEVRNGDTKVGENNDWSGTDALKTAFTATGAFTISDNSKDAAIVLDLPPGSYTAQVSGVNGTTGVALVEIYEVP